MQKQQPASDPAPRAQEHPAVRAARLVPAPVAPPPISREALREIALACGADDASAVSLDHPALAQERAHVRAALGSARSLVSIALRMHVDSVRSPQRSVANLEFHRAGTDADEVAHRIAVALNERGYRALNPSMAFPMEMDRYPGRAWIVSQKTVAVAAGLGTMGLHRNVIHPQFGSFVLLACVITDAQLEGAPTPLDFNPCIDCKLCVAACPVGAIEPEGGFRFSACYDHNYREFMTGFTDFVEEAVEAKDRHEFRERVPLNEAMSLWQSLSYKPNYKAAYCIAVCPAGAELLPRFVHGRAAHLSEVVKPLTGRDETVYVVRGSDAEAHVKRRFPHKRVRIVRSSLRATSARGLFGALPLLFQRGAAQGLDATFHFDLSGQDPLQATVVIRDGALEVTQGSLVGRADVTVRADAALWLDIVSGRRSPVAAVLTRKLRVEGDRSLLDRFARCFPR